MENTETLLKGIRIVEVATYAAGPTTGAILGDFGADVIHIEEPLKGDPYRAVVSQAWVSSEEDKRFNPSWELVNRNKRSLALSLKTKSGKEVFDRLIRQADVFITNMLPARRAQLGTTYERLKTLNERLVYVGISGYGEDGPLKDRGGYDFSAYWASSGLMGMFGEVTGVPPMCRPGMGDRPLGVIAAGAVGLALFHRERTGRGQAIGLSLMHFGMWQAGLDTQRTAALGAPGPTEQRTAPSNPLWNPYRCGDGRWMLLALFPTFDWRKVCDGLGHPELAAEPRFATAELRREHSAEIVTLLDRIFLERSRDDWEARFKTSGFVFAPVLSPSEAVNGEQAKAIDVFFDAKHPRIGDFRLLRSPLNFSETPPTFRNSAPELGEHDTEILGELGYDKAEIDGIIAAQKASSANS